MSFKCSRENAKLVVPIAGMNGKNQVDVMQHQVDKYGLLARDVIPGFPPMVWTGCPDDVEKVFRNEGRFPMRLGLDALRLHRKKRSRSLGLFDHGEVWWKIRSIAQQPLMKPTNIYSYLPAINDIGEEFIDRYSGHIIEFVIH